MSPRASSFLLSLLLASSSTSLPGASISVCDEASLRSALDSGGTILFDCDGVITLSQTLIVSNDVSLEGNGHAVTISGDNRVRVFQIDPGVSVTLRDLTIANGLNAELNGASGGGILNEGTLTLLNCTFSNNVATGGVGAPGDGGFARGGAICSLGGVLRGTNSLFVTNTCLGGAGSIGNGGSGGDGFGGAIFVSGTQYIFDGTQFVSNRSTGGEASLSRIAGDGAGGAIYAAHATGMVVRTRFSSNRASGGRATDTGPPGSALGGGVTVSNGTLHVSNCTFSANVTRGGNGYFGGPSGPGSGGALMNAGSVRISMSSFVANEATGGTPGFREGSLPRLPPCEGGALQNMGDGIIEGCMFATNIVRGSDGLAVGPSAGGPGRGGAINNHGILDIRNSTFAHNLAQGGNHVDSVGPGWGGALMNSNSLVLTHVTIATNSASYGRQGQSSVVSDGIGGGIYSAGSTVLRNSLLSGNLAGTNGVGPLIDEGNNISSDGSCAFTLPGSRNGVNPLLSALGAFGGPTLTMALLEGSPAINAGLASHGLPTDQRGVRRPYGVGVDIGAFEVNPQAEPFLNATRVGSMLELSFPTASGATYELQRSSDLVSWEIHEVIGPVESNGLVSRMIPTTEERCFFRLAVR